MAVSTFKHGVTWTEIPTSVVAPITADSGIPVIIGAAPVQMADNPATLNVPRLYNTYEEFVAEMGFSYDFQSYGLCEAAYCYFVLFNAGPIICINVFDPGDSLSATPTVATLDLVNGQAELAEQNVMLDDSFDVKSIDDATTYTKDTDYIVSYTMEGEVVITRLPTGTIAPTTAQLKVSYKTTDPSALDDQDIIGGVDPDTDKGTGLEAVEDVFPVHRIIPGIILCPGWSQVPEVAAVMAAKGENINGCFKCVAYADVDSEEVIKAQDVNLWKNQNNYVSNRLAACWPRVGLDEKQFWLSTQLGALTLLVDHANGDIPVESPSNKNFKMNKTIAGPRDTPVDIFFGKSSADQLNGQGLVTTINFIGGHKAWGNAMSIYPSSSDPKDRWIPVRRMFDYVGNSIVLTIFAKVDKPGNRRLIDSIVDTLNLWLNSMVSAGNLLGARVAFLHSENSDVELLNGHYKFHVYFAAPTPAEWIETVLEYDVTYLSTLFTPVTNQTPAGAI